MMVTHKDEGKLQKKSPAEFFADNKNIAGFDNPGKCLYTTLRELIENGVDSCESIGVIPDIEIVVEELSRARLNALRGIEHHDRIDEELYQDFEPEEDKKKRLARDQKEKERVEKAGETGKASLAGGSLAGDTKRRDAPKLGSTFREACFYRVTVTDNGSGMPHKEIPLMLGQVLSGTKYGVKQTRGKFGLGAKMALIWSKMTTGAPFQIRSARQGQDFVSVYVLDIDIHRNEPTVHHESKARNPDGWRGSRLSLTIEGNWTTYRSKILKYLRQIAVITPYARFSFKYKPEDDKSGGALDIDFKRRTTMMPPPPQETRHHPRSVDLELVRRLLQNSQKKTFLAFLQHEFSCVDRSLAVRLVEEMRAGVSEDTPPKDLDSKQIVRLHQLLHQVRFPDPKCDHLSPAGEYNLRLGVMKELRPEMVATHRADPRISEGHATVVEAAVSIGGRDVKPGINIFRFANRIPLLFEAGSDVITKTATKRIHWNAYKINQLTDKIGVFVSIVSTKIPFKGAGKEYISDDDSDLVAAVRSAIQSCCLQLRTKLARAAAAREQRQRKRGLEKYVPNVCAAVLGVLKNMAERETEEETSSSASVPLPAATGSVRSGDHPGAAESSEAEATRPKRRRTQGGRDLLKELREGKLTQHILEQRLKEHIDRIDMDMAMEYHLQQGLLGAAKAPLFLRAASDSPPGNLQPNHPSNDGPSSDNTGNSIIITKAPCPPTGTGPEEPAAPTGSSTPRKEDEGNKRIGEKKRAAADDAQEGKRLGGSCHNTTANASAAATVTTTADVDASVAAMETLFNVFNAVHSDNSNGKRNSVGASTTKPGASGSPARHRYLPSIPTEGAEIQILF